MASKKYPSWVRGTKEGSLHIDTSNPDWQAFFANFIEENKDKILGTKKKEPKKYRFFYHYYKQKKKMSIHFRNTCHVVDEVQCMVPCNTKWNKRQPVLVMQGYASDVIFSKDNKTATIV